MGLAANFTFTSSHFLSMRSLLVLAQANTSIFKFWFSARILLRETMKRPSIRVGSSKSTKMNLNAWPCPSARRYIERFTLWIAASSRKDSCTVSLKSFLNRLTSFEQLTSKQSALGVSVRGLINQA